MDIISDENEIDELEMNEESSTTNRKDENVENVIENMEINLDEQNDDSTILDLMDKLPNEDNNLDTNIDLDNVDNIEKSNPTSDRSVESKKSENDITSNGAVEIEIIDEFEEEKLKKIAADPYYLPGEFFTLPEQFDIETFPISHRENSLKEELCLEFVDNFKRQYRHLYGDRKPLIIKPKNECGIEKFVCTTLNPTKLPYPEVYYWEGAAKFVTEFLSLVPLIPCTEVPSRLLSPMTTINLQKGTSFEYSSLLCSLLLGVGYNAYVVSGYSTRETCFMDQTRQPCPILEPGKVIEEKKIPENKNKYFNVRAPKDLNSKFELEQMAKKERLLLEEKLKIQSQLEEKERLLEQPKEDPLFGQRVHSWVLVLAGKREVGESFFIESLTGKAWGVDCKEYLGIESLWNNKNYWINMQVGLHGVGQINFDLNNTMLWEFLLPAQEPVTIIPPIGIESGFEPTEDDQEKSNAIEKYFDLPKSWTRPIQISLKDFEQRSSEGRKETLYRKAKLETYSAYQNSDGLTVRCKKYEDRMLARPLETEEFFQNRRDKLVKRLIDPTSGVISEFFSVGKKSRLAQHHYYIDKMKEHSRKMIFYSDARVDHLMELENTERRLITLYKNRDDFLLKRITVFGKREKKFGPANEREYRRPFETITEEYSRNTSVPAYEDIKEIIFHLSEERISVSFHTADENISGDIIEFLKSNLSGESRKENPLQLIKDSYTYFHVDPSRQKLSEAETYEYYIHLTKKEEASKDEVRNEENEMNEILKLRDSENIENKLDISLFDRVRNTNANETRRNLEKAIFDDKNKTKDVELDYLEPFLLQMNINKDGEITKDCAIKLYSKCLQDFKERVVSKANLLQDRFEKHTEILQEKQQWYQQNQNIMQKQDEEEYLQFCNEATFKITTLEKMLTRHKQIAKFKESELDKKMRNDKRLENYLIAK